MLPARGEGPGGTSPEPSEPLEPLEPLEPSEPFEPLGALGRSGRSLSGSETGSESPRDRLLVLLSLMSAFLRTFYPVVAIECPVLSFLRVLGVEVPSWARGTALDGSSRGLVFEKSWAFASWEIKRFRVRHGVSGVTVSSSVVSKKAKEKRARFRRVFLYRLVESAFAQLGKKRRASENEGAAQKGSAKRGVFGENCI
jgi:hypothetical protein